jgi:hypothetical protein
MTRQLVRAGSTRRGSPTAPGSEDIIDTEPDRVDHTLTSPIRPDRRVAVAADLWDCIAGGASSRVDPI